MFQKLRGQGTQLGKGYRVKWEQEGHTERVRHSPRGLKARMCVVAFNVPILPAGRGRESQAFAQGHSLVKGW